MIPGTEVLTCVTVRLDPPLFMIVTDCEELLPMGTSPKLIDDGATEIAAAVLGLFWLDAAFGVLATPAQPEMDRIAKIAKIKRTNGIPLFPLQH